MKLNSGDEKFMLTQDPDFFCEGEPLHFLWGYIRDAHGLSTGQVDFDSFEERKNDFFFVLGKLMDEGRLKLGNRKTELIMEGTTLELIDMFRRCFPASDEELIEGIWLVIEECPFVVVWVHKGAGENGEDYYEWAF
ncbi:DUF596 domain-containing protein [Xylella fastidiosa subsp. multiplex]|uniref:DUF596 domain-containing protein n=1 Tax=Xylella fastidiosa subsp. multiplex TaxID=644357 RepID=A0A9Q4QR82_XYLFS|nr:DUF596 domain-containing protein [Xylella fastidiosa subsp. multiplex]MBE0276438.1 DUF596 domain-containing protein [Xylella fastidiosa subsp. multiplex]MBE0278643.1 DUF596 domain-containing protein [Xylella fastidiosa subsp. multiplex]MBE0283092.1 DUF596 domain-containing protein [Xylella fastidiosa subsp. multiplex]MRT52430.1 DUF596 domain-containing protein [Xylella fastidiosa subsp. multiplex]